MCECTVTLTRIVFDETLPEQVYIDLYKELIKDLCNYQIKAHISLQFEAYFVNKKVQKFNKELDRLL